MQVTFLNKPLIVDVGNLMILTIFIHLKLKYVKKFLSNECYFFNATFANSASNGTELK